LLIKRLYTTLWSKVEWYKIEEKNGNKERISLVSTGEGLLHSELEESTKDGSHSHGGNVGNVGRGSTLARGRSARSRRSSATGGTRLAVLALGVGLLGGASVRTTDNPVLVLLIETVTVEVTSALHVETTLDVAQLGDVDAVKSTAEVNSTGNGLEAREGDVGKLVVTNDLETTVDGLELRQAEVGELWVAVESDVTGLGEVGGAEALEAVTPETHLTSQVVQRRHGNAADVTEGHIGTTAEVEKLDLQRVHVTSKVDQTGSFGQVVDVDRLEVGVLSDVKVTNLVEGDTVKAGQTSVGDGNVAGLGNTSGELKLLQLGKSLKLDAANAAQRTKVESEETSEAIELEGVADLAEVRGSQGGKVASTGATETTGDLLDVVEGQGVGDVLGDFDITLEGLARAVAVDVTLAGDLDGLAVLTAGGTESKLTRRQDGKSVLQKGHCDTSLFDNRIVKVRDAVWVITR
jgi:hypothetical protein